MEVNTKSARVAEWLRQILGVGCVSSVKSHESIQNLGNQLLKQCGAEFADSYATLGMDGSRSETANRDEFYAKLRKHLRRKITQSIQAVTGIAGKAQDERLWPTEDHLYFFMKDAAPTNFVNWSKQADGITAQLRADERNRQRADELAKRTAPATGPLPFEGNPDPWNHGGSRFKVGDSVVIGGDGTKAIGTINLLYIRGGKHFADLDFPAAGGRRVRRESVPTNALLTLDEAKFSGMLEPAVVNYIRGFADRLTNKYSSSAPTVMDRSLLGPNGYCVLTPQNFWIDLRDMSSRRTAGDEKMDALDGAGQKFCAQYLREIESALTHLVATKINSIRIGRPDAVRELVPHYSGLYAPQAIADVARIHGRHDIAALFMDADIKFTNMDRR